MVELYEQYEQLQNGCEHNCIQCGLWLFDRDECLIEANKKWEAWAKQEHERFGEILKGEK